MALLTGLFEKQPDAAFTPVCHAFDNMKTEWWRRFFPDPQS
ncbi:MAG: hypothetical protein WAK61_19395 [Leclercia sp.]